MPQFDPSTYTSQLFWFFVSFLLFLGFLKKIIIPKMVGILEHRWENTEGHLKKSEGLIIEADNLGREYEEIITQAQQRAHEMISEARHDYYLKLIKEKTKIATQINFKVSAEKRRIAREKQYILDEIGQAADALVPLVEEKIPEKFFDTILEEKNGYF